MMFSRLPFDRHTQALGAAYTVELPVFQGPLGLLLQLIERAELDISEVSLVAVTDQYVQTIEQMADRQPDALADFLVIASKLLYIKSRSLLPAPRPPEEDEEDDASDALLQQLLEYRQFKEVAASLQEREESGLRSYVRLAPAFRGSSPLIPAPAKRLSLGNLDLAELQAVLQRTLARIPRNPPMPRVKTYRITVAEQIELVRTFFEKGAANGNGARRVVFADLLERQATRMEVVVTFLAVLELIKQRELVAIQDETFGEIVLAPA
jgi:segregation and condensation protein A